MIQTQATKIIDRGNSSIISFLTSKDGKALLDKGLELSDFPITDGARPIQIIPITIVSAYWLKQALLGNSDAEALAYACVVESLERRCDTVFKATKTEDEYESKAEVNYQHYWQSSRTFSKRCHVAFSHACWLLANN